MYFLFPMLPLLPILAVYILAAVLPAAFLLRYIYRHDTIEKEPPGLLVLLLLMGVVAAVCSGVLESLAESILNLLVSPSNPIYIILLAFLVVAMIEEGMKFLLLKRCTWNHPAFNYRFDGIVYAVFISLGFAAFENIQYVLHYGLSVALPRALLACTWVSSTGGPSAARGEAIPSASGGISGTVTCGRCFCTASMTPAP